MERTSKRRYLSMINPTKYQIQMPKRHWSKTLYAPGIYVIQFAVHYFLQFRKFRKIFCAQILTIHYYLKSIQRGLNVLHALVCANV